MSEKFYEHTPPIEMIPKNSRFGILYDDVNRQFQITEPESGNELLQLDYETGKYVYAMLRGQQRIEDAGPDQADKIGPITKDRFVQSLSEGHVVFSEEEIQAFWQQIVGSNSRLTPAEADPSVTHRRLYMGKEAFVHTEHDVPKGIDATPHKLNRTEDCHIAAQTFMKYSNLEPISTACTLRESPPLKELQAVCEKNDFPLLVEVATQDPRVESGRPQSAHSLIALGRTDEGKIVCFEKVGIAYPWRLIALEDVYNMYEEDFKSANKGKTKFFWTISRLEEIQ